VLQCVEIVLTAHPTQVNRRTLQYKHSKIAMLLQQHDRADLTAEEKEQVLQDLMREIAALWQTDELRRQRPTPVDGEQAAGTTTAAAGLFYKHTGCCSGIAAVPDRGCSSWQRSLVEGSRGLDYLL
jgi:phosphoenolpyruvate carboxylase